MRNRSYTDEQWKLKVKYDTAFDKLFLKQGFKFYATSVLKRCPNGLNLNTEFCDVTGEMQIVSRCKIYGYDFSAVDHVIGDYYMGEHTTDEMAHVLIDYLQEKDPALYEEIKEYALFVG